MWSAEYRYAFPPLVHAHDSRFSSFEEARILCEQTKAVFASTSTGFVLINAARIIFPISHSTKYCSAWSLFTSCRGELSPTCFVPTFLAQSNEVSGKVEKLQAALADDSAGKDAGDRLLEEIGQLKARVASERVRFSHITETLEAAKGSIEEV